MKRKIFIGLVLVSILAALGMTQGPAQNLLFNRVNAMVSASDYLASSAPWFYNYVARNPDVGRHISIAVDPIHNTTLIAYYDEANGDLLLARYVGSGGNCGYKGQWFCQKVDTANSGKYNSIDIYPMAHKVKFIITYYNATYGALKYATGVCDPSCSFSKATIASGNPSNGYYQGLYTSVKYDSNGVPHVAYQYKGLFTNEIQLYAKYVGNGSGNCGKGAVTGDWQCDTVYSDQGVGMYASLDLDGSDRPHIAFYDADNNYPFVASYIGSGGNCGAGKWLCRRVHQPTMDTGKYISLYVKSTGHAHIAYHNTTNGTLEYAKYVGKGGNCGFSSQSMKDEWQCDEIDDTGTSVTTMGVSIAEDGKGYPVIAYQDVSPGLAPAKLKIARPWVALDLNTVPNCGPQLLFYTWHCKRIDQGDQYLDVAGATSIAVNSAGLATVAYHELDSYPYPADGDLKVAYQRLQVFFPLTLK